ncbi:TOBE domain-containing protein [Escherichia coli]
MLCEEPPADGFNFAVGEVMHIAYLGDLRVSRSSQERTDDQRSATKRSSISQRVTNLGDEVRLCWEVDSCVVLTV